jgi:hypothetical protein
MQLILNGTFCGHAMRVLLDSGATTCFVSKSFIRQHSLTTVSMDPISVTLGDDSVRKTSSGIKDKLYLGDGVESQFDCHEFDLPQGCDALAGYNWMKLNGVIMDTEHDRISMYDRHRTRQIVAMARVLRNHGSTMCTAVDDEGNHRLAYGIHEVPGEKYDILNVCTADMRRLQQKMKAGDLKFSDVDGEFYSKSTEKKKKNRKQMYTASHSSGEKPKVTLRSGKGRNKKMRDTDTGIDSALRYTSSWFGKAQDRIDQHSQYSAKQWKSNFAKPEDTEKFVPRTPRDNDDAAHMVAITFHPDGTFTVNEGGPDEGKAPTSEPATAADKCGSGCTCETSGSGGVGDPAKWEDIRIAVADPALPAPSDEKVIATSAEKSNSDDSSDGTWLKVQDTLYEADASGTQWGVRVDVTSEGPKQPTYARTTLYSLVGDTVTEKFVIDESEIDKTIPEFLEWVERLISHKLGKFKCIQEMKRWQYKEGDPLLKLILKPDAKPQSASYKTPIHLLPELKKWIQEMLDKGMIRRSESTFVAPILVLKKPGVNKDGSPKGYRFVSDFRLINKCIQPPQYHQPDIVSMYERLRTAKYLSTVDMRSGYFNAGLHPDSQDLTAFSSPWGTFSYTVVSQGLISSAAHFQEWVSAKLRKHNILLEYPPLIDPDPDNEGASDPDSDNFDPVGSHMSDPGTESNPGASPSGTGTKRRKGEQINAEGMDKLQTGEGFVANYCDDLIICSQTAEEHKRHLLKLFEVLSEENIYLNPQKCVFFSKYVRYLGAICGQDMIISDPDKVRSIVAMPEPKNNQTEIRGFLGMCSFWRRWIPHYAAVAEPLNDLLKKGTEVPDSWSDAHTAAVKELKSRLISHPVLRQPDPGKQFHIIGDACDHSIGSVLAQMHDGCLLPVAFCSRSLNKHERNYSTQEKECLSIIYAMQKFRHYVLCSKVQVKICTDHHSLQFLQRPGQAVGRVARWSMIMSEYDYDIQWIKGTTNHVGDTLSRLIKLPETDWNNLEVDDDTVHPFLMCWTDYTRLQSVGIQQLLVAGERPVIHRCCTCGEGFPSRNKLFKHLGQHRECLRSSEMVASMQCKSTGDSHTALKAGSTEMQNRTEKTRELPTDISNDVEIFQNEITDGKSEAYWARQEQRLNTECDYPHEQILFSAHRVKVASSPVRIDKMDYCSDSDFQIVYGILLKNKLHEENAEKHCTQLGSIKTAKIPNMVWTKEERSQMHVAEKCYLHNGLLYRRFYNRDALCVPDVCDKSKIRLRWRIIDELHNTPAAGHRGQDGTYAAVSRRFYWKNMKNDIAKFISGCAMCQKHKIRRQANLTETELVQVPGRIGDSYNVDFITKLPGSGPQQYDMIMVAVDRFSQRVFAVPMHESATGADAATAFYDEIVCRHGRGQPREIISDRDTRFGKFWKEFQNRSGTCLRFSTARQQSTNGSAERAIAVLEELMSMYCNYTQDNWAGLLQQFVYSVNDSPSGALQHDRTPLFVEYGFNPRRAIDFLDILPENDVASETIDERVARLKDLREQIYESILEYRTQMKEVLDKRCRRTVDRSGFKPGMKVWLDINGLNFSDFSLRPSQKLNPRFHGPFIITAQPGPNRYEVKLPADCKAVNEFHVNRLKAYNDPDLLKYKGTRRPLPKEFMENNKWEVKEILDDDYKFSTQFYRVRWTAGDETWEPRVNLLPGAKKMLNEYDKSHGIVDGKGETKRLRKRKTNS